MPHSHTTSPGRLLRQQPQRYSDRHNLHISSLGELQPGGSSAAKPVAAQDKNRQAGQDNADNSHDEQQGIKSYLTKSHVKFAQGIAKPGNGKNMEQFEQDEKESTLGSRASA